MGTLDYGAAGPQQQSQNCHFLIKSFRKGDRSTNFNFYVPY